MNSACLSTTQIHDFVNGATLEHDGEGHLAAVDTHLAECPDCRQLVVVEAHNSLSHGATAAAPVTVTGTIESKTLPFGDTRNLPRPGARLGRYIVLAQVGKGGVGAVFAAYDPALDRKVAIKLLAHRGEHADTLVREGRALAKVVHPNVVTVYDVGTSNQTAFVAMEYIEGGSLSAYLKQHAPSPETILRLYIEAAHGLHALHKAGLVHCDFKPSNILVDKEGHAKVADFGLARLFVHEDPEHPQQTHAPSPDINTTQTHEFVGTPAFMAPEQFEKLTITPASDVFSFCVALHHSLFGKRPFAGASFSEVANNVAAGQFKLGESPNVPTSVLDIITRGIQREPAARFRSAQELADALSSTLSRKSRRPAAMIAMALVLCTVVTGMLWLGLRNNNQACGEGQRLAQKLWNSPLATRLNQTIATISPDSVKALNERIDATMTKYAASWAREYDKVCEATHVKKQQSANLLDKRTYCLERLHAHARALLETATENNSPTTITRLSQLTLQLQPPKECSMYSAEDLLARPTHADRARIVKLEHALDRLEKYEDLDQYAEIASGLPSVEREEAALDHARSKARTLRLQALLERNSQSTQETLLRKAIAANDKSPNIQLATKLWTDLAWNLAHQARYSEFETAISAARTLGQRLPDGNAHRHYLEFVAARVLWLQRKIGDARKKLEELAGRMKTVGDQRIEFAAKSLLISVYLHQKHFTLAQELADQALTDAEASFGTRSMSTYELQIARAQVLYARGKTKAARKLVQKTVSTAQRLFSPSKTFLSHRLARLSHLLGPYDADTALDVIKLSKTTLRESGQPHTIRHAELHGIHSQHLLNALRIKEALTEAEASVRLYDKEPEREPIRRAKMYGQLATIQAALGQTAKAIPALEESVSVFTSRLGHEHHDTLVHRFHLGNAYSRAGKRRKAISILESALAAWDKQPRVNARGHLTACTLAEHLARFDEMPKAAPYLDRCLRSLDNLPLTPLVKALYTIELYHAVRASSTPGKYAKELRRDAKARIGRLSPKDATRARDALGT